MFYPSFDEILRFKDSYSMIPISVKVWSDNVTPIRLFQQIKGKYSFLLESVEGGEKWARYSFVSHNPYLVFYVQDGVAYIERFSQNQCTTGESTVEAIDGDPILALKQFIDQHQAPKELNLPRFTGGAVGYIGYDAISLVEDIPDHLDPSLNQDQIRLMFCDETIVFDHLQQDLTFISHIKIESGMTDQELKEAYAETCTQLSERVETMFNRLKDDQFELFHIPEGKPEVEWDGVTSNFTKEQYMDSVAQIKEYIRAGDVLQAVLSQRFSIPIKTDPFNIYRVLRTVNPSPYLYYLDLGDDFQMVGSSPERLVKLEEGKVETNPIAGTRKRGQTREEDEALAQELLADEKERAEHHMLLDLGRNEIGRIAKPGTVRINKNMEVEKFSHVMHIVSTVEGEVEDHYHAVDCLFSCFPAGTVSGAPKIRAMEILAELEKEARNAYAGAIGYFSFSGNHDSCITLRTMVIHQGRAYIQAGAGIVADSVPENEWQETRNKAQAMLVAIQLAETIFEHTDQKGESLHV